MRKTKVVCFLTHSVVLIRMTMITMIIIMIMIRTTTRRKENIQRWT